MLLGELSRWGNRRDEVDALLPAADARARSGSPTTATATATATSSTSARPTAACRTRVGRTPGTRCASPTARSRRRRSRCARCRATSTRRSSRAAHCATEAGDHALAASLTQRADELKRRFNEDFWVDTGRRLLRDRASTATSSAIDGIGSNMGHCLWTGIVDEEKAPLVARALLVATAMFSGWGIRTLSATNGGLQPDLVPLRQRWPHDNAIVRGRADALRLRRGGAPGDARAWSTRRRGSATCCPSCSRACRATGSSFPVSYPTSCSPQAWAAASPLLFLRTLLRFEPDIRTLEAAPRARGARLDRHAAPRTHPDHGRPPRRRGARARSCRCSRCPRASRSSPTRRRPTIARSGREPGERASAKSPAGSVHHSTSSSPAAASSARRPASRVNLALTSVRISSPAANAHVEVERARRAPSARRRAQAHLDPLVRPASNTATCSKRVDVEVGVELAVQHAQHVLVELRGDARRVVVRGLEPVDVLDEVGAEQEVVVGPEPGRDVARGTRARASGSRLPIVPPRNATSRRPPPGSRSRWRSKSPTTACTSTPGYSRVDRGGRVAQRLLAHVERHEARERARRRAARRAAAGSSPTCPSRARRACRRRVTRAISAARASRIARSRRVG